jgi:hypothetical protein
MAVYAIGRLLQWVRFRFLQVVFNDCQVRQPWRWRSRRDERDRVDRLHVKSPLISGLG